MTSYSILFCKDCDTKYYLIMCQDCKRYFCNACFWKCNYCNENQNEILDDVDLESGGVDNIDIVENENENHEFETETESEDEIQPPLLSSQINNIISNMFSSIHDRNIEDIDLV